MLALTLVAALAVAWRFRLRGLVAGLAAYALVAWALGEGPLVDQRLATEDVIDRWDPGNWAGPMGPPDLRALAMPIELQRGPWLLGAGEQRNSRRTGLPPGAYRVELRAAAAQPGPFHMDVDVYAGELPLGHATLTEAEPRSSFPLLLPAGARQLGLSAAGVEGRAVLEEARIVPEALIPRTRRGFFPPPTFAREDRYRVGGPAVRATAVDYSAPEEEGFRLAGPKGAFLVDGPAAAAVRVEVRRPRVAPGDALSWYGREVALGPQADVVLTLPLSVGEDLGRASVVPVELRAPGAWVRFTSTGAP